MTHPESLFVPRVRLLALVAFLITVAFAASCTSGDDNTATTPNGTNSGSVADWLGSELPESATDVRFEEDTAGIDDAARIRFALPASDLDALMTELNIGKDLQAGRRGFPSSSPDWFATDDLTDFAGASGQNSDGRAVQVMADLSDEATVTVYILAFGT